MFVRKICSGYKNFVKFEIRMQNFKITLEGGFIFQPKLEDRPKVRVGEKCMMILKNMELVICCE